MYQKFELGVEANVFVRLQLSKESTLGMFLCQLPLEYSRVISFLPPQAKTSELIQFNWLINTIEDHTKQGGIDWEYRSREADALGKFALSNGRAALFYVDSLAPGTTRSYQYYEAFVCQYNRILKQTPSETITSTEVYAGIPAHRLSEDNLKKYLANSRGAFHLIGVIGQFSDILPTSDGSECITRETA